jgi:hypothetical protein
MEVASRPPLGTYVLPSASAEYTPSYNHRLIQELRWKFDDDESVENFVDKGVTIYYVNLQKRQVVNLSFNHPSRPRKLHNPQIVTGVEII